MDPNTLKRLGITVRGYNDGYERIPDAANNDGSNEANTSNVDGNDIDRHNLRPMYMAKSSSGTLQKGDGRAATPRRALNLAVVCVVAAGIVAWILTIIYWERPSALRRTPNFIVPGDAAWLCQEDEHSTSMGKNVCAPGDGTPDYEPYFPIVYVILGDEGVGIARAIVSNTTSCPVIEFKDNDGGHEIPTVIERAVGSNEILPFAFPVRVCEAVIKRGLTDAYFGGRKIPTVPEDPSSFVVVGDTGLRSKPTNLGIGTCLDGPVTYGIHQCLRNFTQDDIDFNAFDGHFQSLDKWPLRILMKRAVQENPDVLIHMGDFVYRQGPCPYPNNNSATCSGINLPPRFSFNGSSDDAMIMNFVPGLYGDTFWSWWADFFYPSLEALAEVPWIALRGNHESCSRAGRGWFLFLSSQPYSPEAVAGSYCEDHTEPRRIPFEREQFLLVDDSTIEPKDRGFDGLQFVPGDCPTETGSDLPLPEIMNRFLATNPPQECESIHDELDIFTQHFEKVEEMSKMYDTNIYLGHRPIFGECMYDFCSCMDWQGGCANALFSICVLFFHYFPPLRHTLSKGLRAMIQSCCQWTGPYSAPLHVQH